ncbi:MAG TPA: 6-bladed beta-propeller [Candidatus Krumholzibacteria bacterium]|nr:6-bladed beta-propeller [Candidatus Krumholzibacteria bacterium]
MKKFLVAIAAAAQLCMFSAQTVQSQPQFVLSLNGAGGGFNEPRGLDLDAMGNVYVADLLNHRVQKFDSNGNFITMWGSYGSTPGQFIGPFDVAVDASANVYVVEVNNNYRVQKFDSNGAFITTWGSYGSGQGQFIIPLSLAVDNSGNVYVADGDRIQKFDGSGNFISWWTGAGGARGIDVDALGNVYVSDSLGRVVKFDGNGVLIATWLAMDSPFGVAADANGNIFVTETNAGMGPARAAIFTSAGAFVLRWGEGLLVDPRSIVVDAAGSSIYVSDIGRNQVLKFRYTPVSIQTKTWSLVKSIYRK